MESKCGLSVFPTQREAGTAISGIKKNSRRSEVPKRSFYCKECKGWHITSKKKK